MDHVIINNELFAECKVLDNFRGLSGLRTRTRTWRLVLKDPRGQGLSSRTTTLVVTDAEDSCRSKAFSGVCVCVCVCVFVCVCSHHNLKTNDPKVFNTWYREWPWDILDVISFLGQRSRSQGYKVQKHIEGTRVAGVSLHLYRVLTISLFLKLFVTC